MSVLASIVAIHKLIVYALSLFRSQYIAFLVHNFQHHIHYMNKLLFYRLKFHQCPILEINLQRIYVIPAPKYLIHTLHHLYNLHPKKKASYQLNAYQL